MKIALLVNATAGSFEPSKNHTTNPERIAAQLTKLGFDVSLFSVEGRLLKETTVEACKKGNEILVAAGGDGSVSAVVCGILESEYKPTLAILPLGTLNHFAKDLGIPLDLEEAIANVRQGVARKVDAAMVNGIGFINNSSLGLYPLSVRARDKQPSGSGIAKLFATTSALFSVFRKFPIYKVRVEAEGRSGVFETPFLFVGNNVYRVDLLNPGGRDRLDEGLLSLYLAKCRTRAAILKHVVLAMLGTLDQARDFETLTTTALTVDAGLASISISLDGEVLSMRPPLTYTSLPGAIHVVVPAA